MYICHKDPNYDCTNCINIDDDDNTNNTTAVSKGAYTIETIVPDDNDTCPKCLISFFNFRSGENLIGRGKYYWYRSWKGHCQHCKNEQKNFKAMIQYT